MHRKLLLAAAVAACSVAMTATASRADFIYFDPATPIPIPETGTNGWYFDVTTGDYATGANSLPGAEFEIYDTVSGGLATLKFNSLLTAGYEGASLNDPLNIAYGTDIGPSSSFYHGAGLEAAFHQTGTETAGFEFLNTSTNVEDYGWMQVSTTVGGGFPAAMVDWGYDDGGADAYADETPEPASIATVSLFGLGLCAKRRRKQT
jgi:hypothetical protein